jgi:hypothetical protein
MAVPLMQKKSFLRSGEGSLVNYSWTDLADGTGYTRFYVFNIDAVCAPELLISANQYPTQAAYISNGLFPITVDLSPFNTPRTIGGKAICHCGKVTTSSGNGSITWKFQKVSGAVVTDISSDISSYATSSGSAHTAQGTVTETNFKIGDNLRIVITGNGTNAQVYCNIVTSGESMFLDVPFKIED